MNTYILVAGGCIALNINVNGGNHLRRMVLVRLSRLVYSGGIKGLAQTVTLETGLYRKSTFVFICPSETALFITVKVEPD